MTSNSEVSDALREPDATAIGQQAPLWSDASNQHLDNGVHAPADKEAAPVSPPRGRGHAGAIPIDSLSQKESCQSLTGHFDFWDCELQ